jgi:hypothetical protein
MREYSQQAVYCEVQEHISHQREHDRQRESEPVGRGAGNQSPERRVKRARHRPDKLKEPGILPGAEKLEQKPKRKQPVYNKE